MAARKAIPKGLRFEVFKRDQFTCQYCGAHPPAVILHVDHINPVALGGENEIDNLVAACDACNLGKGAVPLTNVPQSLASKASEIAEREEQLRGYQEILEAKRNRLEDETWRVAEEMKPGCSDAGYPTDQLRSIRMFIEKIGVHEVLDTAELARSKIADCGDRRLFLYFCKVCWNKIRGDQ